MTLNPETHRCIACDYPLTYPLFHPEDQPMAAMILPKSKEESRALPHYPMNFHSCARCGHIFNVEFEYAEVPYEDNSNLMYNAGTGWQDYMDQLIEQLIERYSLENTTWLEIGCGDGHFLHRLGQKVPGLRLIGFEPGREADNAEAKGIEAYRDYFMPERDVEKFKPDFLVCRHVIEHLDRPKDFVAQIAYWCQRAGIAPVFIAEVPRINKAIEQARINDYLYEHVSNFTDRSFTTMFEHAGYEVLRQQSVYHDEVLVAEVRPLPDAAMQTIASETETYRDKIEALSTDVQVKVMTLTAGGKSLAFWGGTGKGASFLNNFDLPEEDFPIVVDSDYQKCGKFVPGAGQEIRPPEYLIENPVDMIIITTQWRAKDIYAEIQRREIPHESIYVLIGHELQVYTGEEI